VILNRLLAAAASLVALAIAAPAFAADTPDSTDVTINGTIAPACSVTATSNSVTLPDGSIANSDSYVNPGVAAAIANALNGAGVYAWCNGNHNAVVVSRTALVTNGGVDQNGFASGVRYDLWITIADAFATNTNSSLVDGSSDGAGNGPGIGVGTSYYVSAFGQPGPGTQVIFSAEGGTGNVSAVSNPSPSYDGPYGGFTTTNARLLAGTYTGHVTITLTPGNV
jgi:hypothetical protein